MNTPFLVIVLSSFYLMMIGQDCKTIPKKPLAFSLYKNMRTQEVLR
ncbi:hypothetical protein SD77_0643 [Bacillus badius]|uniref:Uncharacterized protein n=1 Tax=Bacillus badius TaxID=1455 RepID=A0ABR5B1C8_BACBA|nr:hypothetical protein SD77_0643 [Bacillus badius]